MNLTYYGIAKHYYYFTLIFKVLLVILVLNAIGRSILLLCSYPLIILKKTKHERRDNQ